MKALTARRRRHRCQKLFQGTFHFSWLQLLVLKGNREQHVTESTVNTHVYHLHMSTVKRLSFSVLFSVWHKHDCMTYLCFLPIERHFKNLHQPFKVPLPNCWFIMTEASGNEGVGARGGVTPQGLRSSLVIYGGRVGLCFSAPPHGL